MKKTVAHEHNIAIFIPTLKSGGAEKQALLLAKTLTDSLINNIYLIVLHGEYTPSHNNIQIINKTIRLKIYYLKGSLVSRLIYFTRIIKQEKIDIIFNYLTSCDIYGAIVGRICKIKNIYGGIRNSRLSKDKIIAERIIHNFISTKTICNCYSGVEYLKTKGFCEKKFITIPNCYEGIDAVTIKKDNEIKTIITVGRFVPEKDYFTAIKSIYNLNKIRSDFIYKIVGYGKLEGQIKEWRKEFDLEDKIQIIISPNNIAELLKEADIYLSTSLYEGTSNSILEAMNACNPIIATNVGDNDKMVIDNKNGYIVSVGDSNSIALYLDKLMSDYNMRIDFGKYSHSILKENYSEAIFRNNYLNLINSL